MESPALTRKRRSHVVSNSAHQWGFKSLHPLASVPAYTYFQNLVIQAAHFSYPEAFALAGGCKLSTPHCTNRRQHRILDLDATIHF
jgi:hypothetical protein